MEQPAFKRDGRETGFFESHNSVSQRVIVESGFTVESVLALEWRLHSSTVANFGRLL